MNLRSLLYIVLLSVVIFACARKDEKLDLDMTGQAKAYVAQGDSMIYGLACDGCTDSTLIFLPDSGGDPVKYFIVSARRNQMYFGHPDVGDNMAVFVSPTNKNEVRMAIDLEQMCGTWVYEVMPTKRKMSSSVDSAKIMASLSEKDKLMFDSMLQSVMVPREYGYTLKRDYTASSVGGPPRITSLDNDIPVVYPSFHRYTEWHVFNGKIIFTYSKYGKSVNGSRPDVKLLNDTAELVDLRPDSMIIRFADGVKRFHLKKDSTQTN